jgi:hypothetical protein
MHLRLCISSQHCFSCISQILISHILILIQFKIFYHFHCDFIFGTWLYKGALLKFQQVQIFLVLFLALILTPLAREHILSNSLILTEACFVVQCMVNFGKSFTRVEKMFILPLLGVVLCLLVRSNLLIVLIRSSIFLMIFGLLL